MVVTEAPHRDTSLHAVDAEPCWATASSTTVTVVRGRLAVTAVRAAQRLATDLMRGRIIHVVAASCALGQRGPRIARHGLTRLALAPLLAGIAGTAGPIRLPRAGIGPIAPIAPVAALTTLAALATLALVAVVVAVVAIVTFLVLALGPVSHPVERAPGGGIGGLQQRSEAPGQGHAKQQPHQQTGGYRCWRESWPTYRSGRDP